MTIPIAAVIGTWVILGTVTDLAQRSRLGRVGMSEVLRRLRNLPRADWGKAVAHSGLGLLFVCAAAIEAGKIEDIRVVQPGESFAFVGYEVRLDGVRPEPGPNYQADRAYITLLRDGAELAELTPEKRFYPVQQFPTTEAGIDRGFTRDLYIVIGDQQANGGWVVRSFLKPMANVLWASMIIMALGGALSLTDRRYRLGAGVRTRGARAVPAE